jgi:hypothetical protein
MSVPRILVLVLALLQAGGIVDLMRRVACEDECRRDGCEDDCAPGNDAPQCSCHCPSGVSCAPPAVAVAPVMRPATAVAFVAVDELRASPDSREILHVPRLRVG